MEHFLTVSGHVAVLFVLMGVGAACRRARLLDERSVKGMVDVLLMVVTPCLMIHVFRRPFDPAMLRSLGVAFVCAVAIHAAMIALAAAFLRPSRAAARPVLRVACVFSNAGFMAIPLEQAVLGEKGVFFGVVYVVVFNVLIWSWGLFSMGGRIDRRTMLVNPGTVGLAVGLPLFLFSVPLPAPIARPVAMLADLNTPLAMLVTGYYLAGARLGAAAREPSAYVAAALRLVVCPLAATAALYPFRGALDREMMLALVIAASAPAAAMVTMFSSKFGRDVDLAVALVSATTLASIATMPAAIAWAMRVLG